MNMKLRVLETKLQYLNLTKARINSKIDQTNTRIDRLKKQMAGLPHDIRTYRSIPGADQDE